MSHKLSQEQIKTLVEKGAAALYGYCRDKGIHHVVTGSSGGLDSAVTLGFAQKACALAGKEGFKLSSVGLIMPCESSAASVALGREAIRKFGAHEAYMDLKDVFAFGTLSLVQGVNERIKEILIETGGNEALSVWEESKKIAQGNIKARLRMMYGTYHSARMMRGIVLSTDNLSEYWMAFWTLNGDVGDFGIIQKILKGLELYDIARYLGVPAGIIAAKPDDGLGVSGGDEDQLGANYPTLDRVMIELIQKGFDPDGRREQLANLPEIAGVDRQVVYKLAARAIAGAFKRRGAIVLERKDLGLPEIKDIKLN